MRYVLIEQVQPGMESTGSLYDYYGSVIISPKTKLTEEDIQRIKEFGYHGIYINDRLSEDIDVEDVISPTLRAEGLS